MFLYRLILDKTFRQLITEITRCRYCGKCQGVRSVLQEIQRCRYCVKYQGVYIVQNTKVLVFVRNNKLSVLGKILRCQYGVKKGVGIV